MASLVAVGVDALPSSDGIVADQKAHAESNGPRSSPGSSASAGITIPRAESPVHAEDKNGDRVSDTFDHVMGSLDRSEEGVAGLTERISGMGFDMEPDARFSMGEYMTGIGGDGMASPARASEGMGSLLSLDDDRESFAPQRSSLSAFEGPDRESFAPARSSLDDCQDDHVCFLRDKTTSGHGFSALHRKLAFARDPRRGWYKRVSLPFEAAPSAFGLCSHGRHCRN